MKETEKEEERKGRQMNDVHYVKFKKPLDICYVPQVIHKGFRIYYLLWKDTVKGGYKYHWSNPNHMAPIFKTKQPTCSRS